MIGEQLRNKDVLPTSRLLRFVERAKVLTCLVVVITWNKGGYIER